VNFSCKQTWARVKQVPNKQMIKSSNECAKGHFEKEGVKTHVLGGSRRANGNVQDS